VIPGAGTWLGLFGHVAGPPGFAPPDDCLFGLLRRRLESTPAILATKGKAVTASAARATVIKEYFMLGGIFRSEYRTQELFRFRGLRSEGQEIFELYIFPELTQASTRKEYRTMAASPQETKYQVHACSGDSKRGSILLLGPLLNNSLILLLPSELHLLFRETLRRSSLCDWLEQLFRPTDAREATDVGGYDGLHGAVSQEPA